MFLPSPPDSGYVSMRCSPASADKTINELGRFLLGKAGAAAKQEEESKTDEEQQGEHYAISTKDWERLFNVDS